MRLLLVLAITFACSFSNAALPWSKTPLTEIPAYNSFPALTLTTKNLHQGTYFSSVQGDDTEFLAWVPDNFDPIKTYHIIIFLGGSSGSMWQLGYYADQLRVLMSDPIFDNYVIVAPDIDNWSLWGATPTFDGPAVVMELKKVIEAGIKESGRAFVMGHSNGGPGAIHLAYIYPKNFVAVAAVSPTLLPWSPFNYNLKDISNFVATYAPMFTTQFFDNALQNIAKIYVTEAQWNKFDPYKHITNDKLLIPLSIFAGAKDELGFCHLSQLYVEFAKKNGVSITYFEDPNRTHDIGNAMKEAVDFFEASK